MTIQFKHYSEGGGTPTQTKSVALSMAGGNQVVTPDSGYTLSQVTVEKPSTMIAENIKKDIVIGGVTGTYEGGGSVYSGYKLKIGDNITYTFDSGGYARLYWANYGDTTGSVLNTITFNSDNPPVAGQVLSTNCVCLYLYIDCPVNWPNESMTFDNPCVKLLNFDGYKYVETTVYWNLSLYGTPTSIVLTQDTTILDMVAIDDD